MNEAKRMYCFVMARTTRSHNMSNNHNKKNFGCSVGCRYRVGSQALMQITDNKHHVQQQLRGPAS